MLSIIEALENEKSLSSLQIARAVKVCIPDAREVTQMLQYLTSFGKIISNQNGKWEVTLKGEDPAPPSKEFRFKYIITLTEIIKILHRSNRSASELAQKTSQEIDDIEEALEFLALITEKGQVHLTKSGTSDQWSLRSWLEFL